MSDVTDNGDKLMFTYQTTVKMHETDASGFLFFAAQFKIAHDAYEAFLNAVGFGIQTIISKSDFLLPIVHAEADYFIPSAVGDRITVQLQVESISKNSFQIIYDFINEFGKIAGNAKTVHVAIDKKKQTKMALPEDLVKALREYSSEED